MPTLFFVALVNDAGYVQHSWIVAIHAHDPVNKADHDRAIEKARGDGGDLWDIYKPFSSLIDFNVIDGVWPIAKHDSDYTGPPFTS
jgi:hypothetical protein